MHSVLLNSALKAMRHEVVRREFQRTITHSVDGSITSILAKHTANNPDWRALRREILDVDPRRINPNNINYVILSNCSNDERTRPMAIQYAQHLDETGEELNLAGISALLKIYARVSQDASTDGHELESKILELYKRLIVKHKDLDARLTESVTVALCTTQQWKECLQLVDALPAAHPTSHTYNALITAAFRHGEESLGWKYMHETIQAGKPIHSSAYISYINNAVLIKKYSEFCHNIEQLFEFWSVHDIVIDQEVAKLLSDVFSTKHDRKAAYSTINHRGYCSKCRLQLPKMTFTDADFNELKTAVFKRVIVGKDVFRKTTPAEVTRFNEFLARNQRFDVIIDGLNVAFNSGHRSQHQGASFIISVVQHYVQRGARVLLLGRSHMAKWPDFRQITSRAEVFLTQNISQDDPYLLYFALHSGEGTIIVSKDMMRGHLHLLKEPHLKQMFKRWLSISRHVFKARRPDGSVVIQPPKYYINSAQKHQNVWHLPCATDDSNNSETGSIKSSGSGQQEPALWLCIQL